MVFVGFWWKWGGRFLLWWAAGAVYWWVCGVVGGTCYLGEGCPVAQECEICGKRPQMGNQVETRGKAKYLGGVGTKVTGITRRRFSPNLQRVKVMRANGAAERIRVCTRCIRSGAIVKAIRSAPFRLPEGAPAPAAAKTAGARTRSVKATSPSAPAKGAAPAKAAPGKPAPGKPAAGKSEGAKKKPDKK